MLDLGSKALSLGERKDPKGVTPMQGNSRDLDAVLKRLTAELLKLEPVAIYLFGSQATGGARPDSDIDLAVLLPEGKELPVLERLDLIDRLQGIAERRVDLVVVNTARLPLQFEIIHTGRVLYESNFDARTDAEDMIIRDYLDLEPMYEQNFREVMELSKGGIGGCSMSS
ncbi:MAG: hypothetical protein PWQ41_1777 [Bacillota bacterium]|jgi:hypothetical protein|nr:hypothetical protein [Bacillota bacterium]MDK2926003.1 hypothetical protein [Bacillota bacterium]